MKCAVEMGSYAMTYKPSFIKIGSGSQKLTVGIHRHSHGDELINLHFFFQNKESSAADPTIPSPRIRMSASRLVTQSTRVLSHRATGC
jgi:hypothetical protein